MLPYALVFALLAAVFIALTEFLDREKRPFTVGLITLVAAFIINLVVIYFGLPYFTHILADGYPLLVFLDLVIAILVSAIYTAGVEYRNGKGTAYSAFIGGIALIVWLVVAAIFTSPAIFCDDPGKDRMAALLRVEDVSAGTTVKDNDVDRLVKVTPSNALLRAKRAIGGDANIGSYLEVNRAYLQEVAGHPYFIVDLAVKDWRGFGSRGSVIPGFVVVDAINPNQEAEFRSGYKMRFVPNALWGENLNRYVYENFLLGTAYQVMDLDGLEVSDDWQPYYTGTIVRQVVGFSGKQVEGVITVNAQTGEIKFYRLGEQPKWVNRIYPLELVGSLADWWGKYFDHDDCPFQGPAGQRTVDRANDLFTKEGLVYQITMTSIGKDQALTEMITVNPLTGKALRSKLTGATVQAVESVIEETTKKITAEGFDAQECELQHLLGRDVWYCALIGRAGGKTELAGNIGGYALVQAKYSADNTKVIVGEDLRDAYAQLRTQIANEGAGDPTLAQATQKIQITGTLARKATITDRGKQYVVFTMTGPQVPARVVFRADAGNVVAALMQPGDVITVTAITVVFDNYTDVIDITDEALPSFK